MVQEVKKRKLPVANRSKTSKVFSRFRVVGNVSNSVPFAVGTLGSTFYIVTSVGSTFQIYDANTLHMLFVGSKETEMPIVAMETHFQYVFVAYGNKISICRRGNEEHLVELKSESSRIMQLCIFGDYLCATTEQNEVHVFKKKNSTDKFATEFYTKLEISSLYGSKIVSIVHLPTYLNKVVVVTDKHLLILNVKTGKTIYTSNEIPETITAADVAPVLDILALGSESGKVLMFNVKKGKVVRKVKFPQIRISSISFRTDGLTHICVGTSGGDLIFYDLDRRSRVHLLKNVHKEEFGGVVKASFLNGQPIVVTSGGDNCIKEYVFDPPLSQGDLDAVVQPPRLLRFRGGHSSPPSCISFADADSHFLLSASRDKSLWAYSLRKDAQSQELSQRMHKKSDGGRLAGSVVKEKLPEIIALAIENARVGEWENVLTAHKDQKFACTWDLHTKRVGRWRFDTTDDGFVKSVAISQCGNFGLVGSSNGAIVVYNMQSGMIRKKYKFHKKAVTGIALDVMNRKMVSCGLDGKVGFYDFNKSTLLGSLQLDAPITSLVYHKSSDLVAMALDDLSVIVIDTVTQRIVRQLWGHSNRITAFDFSPDCRWLVTASLDSTLRTWDLPTGGCIDGMRLNSVATNVKFSPKGDFLATSHVTGNGICIWTNKSQFKSVSNRVVSEEDFVDSTLPNNSSSGGGYTLEGAFDEVDENADSSEDFTMMHESVEQINSELLTLSVGPRNKMKTLVNLDVIKQRSKPKEAPKKPEQLPFFLKLSGGKVGDDAVDRENATEDSSITGSTDNAAKIAAAEEQLAKIKPTEGSSFESKFTKLLRECAGTKEFSNFLSYLVELQPSAIDLEIRSLHSFEPFDELIWFIEALTFGLISNQNFDLYEAFMSLFLKVHGDVINSNNKDERIATALKNWNTAHSKTDTLDDLVKFCSGVLNFVSNA